MLLVAFNSDPNFLIEMLLVESCLSKSKPNRNLNLLIRSLVRAQDKLHLQSITQTILFTHHRSLGNNICETELNHKILNFVGGGRPHAHNPNPEVLEPNTC